MNTAPQPATDPGNRTAPDDLHRMTEAGIDRSLQHMESGKFEQIRAEKTAAPDIQERKTAVAAAEKTAVDQAKRDIWREENAALAGKFEDLHVRMKSDQAPTETEKKQFYRELVNQVAREHQEMTPWMLQEGNATPKQGVGSTFDRGVDSMTDKLWSSLMHKIKLDTFLSGPIDRVDAVNNLKKKLEEDLRTLAEGHRKQLEQKKQLTKGIGEPGSAAKKPEPSELRQAIIEIAEWAKLTPTERKAKARLLGMTEADVDRSMTEIRAGELRHIPVSEAGKFTEPAKSAVRPRQAGKTDEPWYKKLFGGKKAA